MATRISRDDLLMAVAVMFSARSTCERLKVGAVLAIDGRILSTGYAGAPSGLKHCDPGGICDLSKPCLRTVHAEMNAITFAARYGISIDGSTLYTTHSPCQDCAKAIINAGIRRVVYREPYRDSSPLELLEACDIETEQSRVDDFIP